jgi:D-amino-acid oxidase
MTSRIESRHALVVGGGVSGLTTALVLARRGWGVTVTADRFRSGTVPAVAGALREWPPSVCGRHHAEPLLARSAGWAMVSYRRFAQLAASPHIGVSLRPAIFSFRGAVPARPPIWPALCSPGRPRPDPPSPERG